MKTKAVISCFALLSVISLVLGACNYPGTPPLVPPAALANSEVPAIIMQRPLDGSIYSVGAVVELQTLVRSAGSLSINELTFLVNGTSIGAANASQGLVWNPPQPGEYYIQSRAVLSDGATAISSPVRICVVPLANWFSSEARGYTGLCEIPTRIPNAASSGSITIRGLASPNIIRYSAQPACSLTHVDLTFVGQVDDPQDLVAFASVDLYLDTPTGYYQFFLTWITTRPVNQKEYRTSLQLGPANLRNIPNGQLHWTIKAYGRDGQELQRTDGAIPVQVIECTQQPLQIATPDLRTSSPTPEILYIITPTPTQGILYIASPTRKPRKNNGNGNPTPVPTQPCNPLVRVCP